MNPIKGFIWTVFKTIFIYSTVKSMNLESIEYGKVNKENNNCMEAFVINGSQTGPESFSFDFEGNCSTYKYQIKCLNKSSIIKIKSVFTDFINLTNSKGVGQRQIQVVLEESTILNDGKKSMLVMDQWSIDTQNDTTNNDKIYFSRTTDLTVTLKITGNWSDCNLELFYEEVAFKVFRSSTPSGQEGKISPWTSEEGRRYRPNSVYIFQIAKSDDLNASSIHLVLNKLQIDEGIGEYLLIGPGKDVFQGSPPLFISSSQSKKKIKINDVNAYIVLVATSTRYPYAGFEITWRYNGTRITKKEDITVAPGILDDLNSMPICIFNTSAAFQELNKEDAFREFRERLASIGTEYANDNNMMRVKIDSSQVRIVRVSALLEKEDALYVMVNIQQTKDGKPIFNWKQMRYILNQYSSRFSSKVINGYKIQNCPEEKPVRSMWANAPFYVIAPLLCSLFLLLWNWKHTPFSRILSKKIRKDMMIPAGDIEYFSNYERPNEITETEYVSNYEIPNPVPKLLITSDEGRRCTWTHDEDIASSGPEQDSDVEVFSIMNLQRSNSSRSNPREPTSARSSTRSQKRPEINMAFLEDEEYKDETHNAPDTSPPNKGKIYDSVNSRKGLLSRSDIEETTDL